MVNTHKAIMLAETRLIPVNLKRALEEAGVDLTQDDLPPIVQDLLYNSDTTDAEKLTEFMGRLCYKSFEPGLNPNVTKIREGNRTYLGNVLAQKHGSVFEHASVTFVLFNVSRILTHELVRHRAGTAYSQESQRFVRLDDFQLYIPDLTSSLMILGNNDNDWVQDQQARFVEMAAEVTKFTQGMLKEFIQEIGLDVGGVSFHVKKQITSALRRLIPGGVNTNIGVTANHRTWRHIIANRTAPGAEIEIVEVLNDVGLQLQERYPNIYQDMNLVDSSKQLTFQFEKI